MTASVNKHDLLLTYLSEKGSGAWDDLKSAWEWICNASADPSGRAWVLARDLEALGHIEVAWAHGLSWCAAPPLLTMIPRSGGRAFVTGARTRYFLNALREAAEAHGVWLDECGLQHGPTSYYLACGSNLEVEQIAVATGAAYTYQVAEQIAGLLPALDSYARIADGRELPRGLELEIFTTADLTWAETDQREQPGLYRCRTYEGHLHALRDPLGNWQRVIKEIGIFEVLRWESKAVLSYDGDEERLEVPADASLPALHARAATLCSGRLPRYRRPPAQPARSNRVLRSGYTRSSSASLRGRETASARLGTLTYANVPQQIAEKIAASLSQRLEGVSQ